MGGRSLTPPRLKACLDSARTAGSSGSARRASSACATALVVRITACLAAVSPDGKTLAICNSDGTITLWNVTDPARPVKIGRPLNANANVNSVAFTPDGNTLITGTFSGRIGEKSQVKIWRL